MANYFDKIGQVFLAALDAYNGIKELGSLRVTVPDYKNIALEEGMELEAARWKLPSAFTFGVNTISADGTSAGTSLVAVSAGGPGLVPLGKHWFLDSVSGYVSSPVFMQVDSGITQSGHKTPVSGAFLYPLNKVAFSQDQVFTSLQGPVDPTVLKVVTAGQWTGSSFSSDTNYSAKHKVVCIGDSNFEGTSMQNGTSKNDLCTQMLINWLNTQGVSCRRVEKSIGGKTTTSYNAFLNSGKLDINEPSLIIYNLGTNDYAGADVANRDTAMVNMDNLIVWKRLRYPNAILVICSPFVASSGSARETWLANFLRPAISAKVAATADPKILHCNFANVLNAPYNFTNNNDTYFSTNDSSTSGNRYHHNKAGHVKDFEVMRDFAIANDLTDLISGVSYTS